MFFSKLPPTNLWISTKLCSERFTSGCPHCPVTVTTRIKIWPAICLVGDPYLPLLLGGGTTHTTQFARKDPWIIGRRHQKDFLLGRPGGAQQNKDGGRGQKTQKTRRNGHQNSRLKKKNSNKKKKYIEQEQEQEQQQQQQQQQQQEEQEEQQHEEEEQQGNNCQTIC